MKKIYNIFNSIAKLFKFVFKRNTNEKVTVEFRELDEDQVPEAIRKAIEMKEKELKREAQM